MLARPSRAAASPIKIFAAGLSLLVFGCGGSLNPTPVTCPLGRTLLDGVCVKESVADYVACVRSQGAQIGGQKSQSLSAEVGYAGVRAGGAAEVKEDLERKYAASDVAILKIIDACNAQAGLAPSAGPGASASPGAAPEGAGQPEHVEPGPPKPQQEATPPQCPSDTKFNGAECRGFDGRVGKMVIKNDSLYPVKVSLWHPDAGKPILSFTVAAQGSVVTDKGIGNDWGVQLGTGGVKSLDRIAGWEQGQWILSTSKFNASP